MNEDDHVNTIGSFRFEDKDDYEIFSILNIARAWAGKRDSCRHSATGLSKNVVVAGTSYQM